MPVKSSHSTSLPYFIALATLCLLLCVAAGTKVQAQKKPPILSDKDISAFNKLEIQELAEKASDTTNPGAAKLARNKLIAITVEQVDSAFNEYRQKYRKNTDRLNFLFDFLEIGASTAISIVGGARPRALIGEGLSLFQGSRSAFNKDFRFLERQILFDKMVAKRSEKLAAIYNKLNQEVLEYPWEQSRSELRDYFFAGTIDEALSSLSRDTGAEAATSEAALIKAKEEAGIVGAASKEQLDAHEAFAKVIDPIVASNADATARSKNATDDIATQQKQIDDENAKPVAERAQATIDAANAAKEAAEIRRDKAKDDKDKLLEKMKSIFSKVADNPILTPLLVTISMGKGIQPAQKERIEDSLKRARENDGTFEDYLRVLGNLRRVVVDMLNKNPSPNSEFHKILVANQ